MKIEFCDDSLKIFIQNNFFPNVNWEDKEQVVQTIKDLFFRIRRKYHLHLKGLYKVRVYPHKVGIIIEAIQLEEDTYTNADIDLRIILLFNKDFYLKVEDCSFLDNETKSWFYKDSYYIDLDTLDEITKYIEYGTIVSEDEI